MRCSSARRAPPASGSRCMRMPTCGSSRTACCAAATEAGRPTVTGSTTPGNSTDSRTGRMISAFGGRLMPPSAAGGGAEIGSERTRRSWRLQPIDVLRLQAVLCEADHQAAIHERWRTCALVAAGRQRHAPLEAALRQLQAVDRGVAQLGRQQPESGDRAASRPRSPPRRRRGRRRAAPRGPAPRARSRRHRPAAPRPAAAAPTAAAGRTAGAAARPGPASRRPRTTSSLPHRLVRPCCALASAYGFGQGGLALRAGPPSWDSPACPHAGRASAGGVAWPHARAPD